MPTETQTIPQVSIILPAYNAQSFLDETIRGILAQTFQRWELLIIDDGSKDNTLEIARRYEQDARIRAFGFSNGGEAAARNRGFEKSSPNTELIMFLDHDDILEAACLETLVAAIAPVPNAVGAYCSGRSIDEKGAPAAEEFLDAWCRNRQDFIRGQFTPLETDKATPFASLAYICCISSMSSCLLRRQFLPAPPLFESEMRTGSADLHLYLRLALQGDFIFFDQPLYLKRQHSHNMTNNHDAIDASVLYALRDIARTCALTPDQYSALRRSYQLKTRKKAYSDLGRAKWGASLGRFTYAAVQGARGVSRYIKSLKDFS